MAIVVESTETAQANSTDTVTVTKPTGLAVGDLMVATLSLHNGGNTTTETWDTASGWTLATENNSTTRLRQSVQWKIAEASDVAASNFSFTASGSVDTLLASVLRCSGHTGITTVGTTDTESQTGANSNTLSGTLTGFTTIGDGGLCVMLVGGFDAFNTTLAVSGYTTTGVTYSELYDDFAKAGAALVGISSSYGVQATAAEISAYGATYSTNIQDHFATFVVFNPQKNASGENALVTTTSTAFTAGGTADAQAENALATATSAANVQSGKGEAPTPFSNTTKSNPTWTNQTKS